MKNCAALWFCLALFSVSVFANNIQPAWLADGPYVAAGKSEFEIPVNLVGTKLYVGVEVSGKVRRFVLDTGSPSMIDIKLAHELGLKILGKNKGRDAHGAEVETEIVQANLRIGGVDFQQVPLMAANFSESPLTRAMIGDGVLGSELLTLGAWQFDLKNCVIRFNTELKKLPYINKAATLKLYQFGYPYAPIFDVKFSKNANSKAMFDTGSPSLFAISDADFYGASNSKGVGRVVSGYGSPGISLGGRAPDAELFKVELKSLSIGKLDLGSLEAERRNLSPSLIGARLLKYFIVTLDSRSEKAYFKKFVNGPFEYASFGFTLSVDKSISIGAVWDESPAKAAGLRPGLELTSINGVDIEMTDSGILRAYKAMEGEEIELGWKGGAVKLKK